jgi:hypothetical protein
MIGRGLSWAIEVCGLSGARTMGGVCLRVGRWALSYGQTGTDVSTTRTGPDAPCTAGKTADAFATWLTDGSAEAAARWSRLEQMLMGEAMPSAPCVALRETAAEFLEGILQALNDEADRFVEAGDTEGETALVLACAELMEAKDKLLGSVER